MSEHELRELLAAHGTTTLSINDLLNVIGIGLPVLLAIQNVSQGRPGIVDIPFKGRVYEVAVTPK